MEFPLRFIDTVFLMCISRNPEEWIEPCYQIISLYAPDIACYVRGRCKRITTSHEHAGFLAAVIRHNFQYMETLFTTHVHPYPYHKFNRAIYDAETDACGSIPYPAMDIEDIYNRPQHGNSQLVLVERLFEHKEFNLLIGGLTLVVAVRDNSVWLLHKVLDAHLKQQPNKAFAKMIWSIVRLSVILSRNTIFSALLNYPYIAGLISDSRWDQLAIIACNRVPTRMHGGIYRFDDDELSLTNMEYRTQEDVVMAENVLAKNKHIPIDAIEAAINSDNIDILRIFRLHYGHLLIGVCQSTLTFFETRIGTSLSPATTILMGDWHPLNSSHILWIATRMQRGAIIEKMLFSGMGVSSIRKNPIHIRHIAASSIRMGINSSQFSKIAHELIKYTEIATNNNEFLFSILWNLIIEEKLDNAPDKAIYEHAFIRDISVTLLTKTSVVMSEPCFPRSFTRFKTYQDIVSGSDKYVNNAYEYYYDLDTEHDRILVLELGQNNLKARELRIQKIMERIILPARYNFIRNGMFSIIPFKQELLVAHAIWNPSTKKSYPINEHDYQYT